MRGKKSKVKWIEFEVECEKAAQECVAASLLDYSFNGVCIEDYSDIESCTWDYIDEEILKKDKDKSFVRIYLSAARNLLRLSREITSNVRRICEHSGFKVFSMNFREVDDEDWISCWQKYYKTIKVTKRLVINPVWEQYSPEAGEVVIKLNPGSAFGTGMHESTRLCMEMLDSVNIKDKRVLDLGCGSGILSVTSALLGAKYVEAVDIDSNAVKITHRNAELNGVIDKVNGHSGDLFSAVFGKYDVITANIVADVIINVLAKAKNYMNDSAILIVSGIINTRADDIKKSAAKRGFKVTNEKIDSDWYCFCLECK